MLLAEPVGHFWMDHDWVEKIPGAPPQKEQNGFAKRKKRPTAAVPLGFVTHSQMVE